MRAGGPASIRTAARMQRERLRSQSCPISLPMLAVRTRRRAGEPTRSPSCTGTDLMAPPRYSGNAGGALISKVETDGYKGGEPDLIARRQFAKGRPEAGQTLSNVAAHRPIGHDEVNTSTPRAANVRTLQQGGGPAAYVAWRHGFRRAISPGQSPRAHLLFGALAPARTTVETERRRRCGWDVQFQAEYGKESMAMKT